MTEAEFSAKKHNIFSTIIGCAFRAYNYWHSGVDELVYEAGLMCELDDAGLFPHRQEEFPIYYKGRASAVRRRVDLVVSDRDVGNIVLELKALDTVGDSQRKQLWSYMRLMNFHLGMLINFSPKGVYTEKWEYDEESHTCHRST